MQQEIPHGIAVEIEKFEQKDKITKISATIYCEKENHKKIIIGNSGSTLKKIGEESRKDIERMLNQKVFLELWVKVKENWRNKEEVLHTLGYEELKK